MYSISEFAGLLVKQAREEKQWDQQYLADELDIDIRTLKKIEAGKSDIPFDTLSNLIHLLEISPKILFYAERTETGVEMDKMLINDQQGPAVKGQLLSARHISVQQAADGIGKPVRILITAMGQQRIEGNMKPAIAELFHAAGHIHGRQHTLF